MIVKELIDYLSEFPETYRVEVSDKKLSHKLMRTVNTVIDDVNVDYDNEIVSINVWGFDDKS